VAVPRGNNENIISSYLIDEFLRAKIFVVGENVRLSFSALMFKGCL